MRSSAWITISAALVIAGCGWGDDFDLAAFCPDGTAAEREQDARRDECRDLLLDKLPEAVDPFFDTMIVLGTVEEGDEVLAYVHGVDEEGRPLDEAALAAAEWVAEGRGRIVPSDVIRLPSAGKLVSVVVVVDVSGSMRPRDVEVIEHLAERIVRAVPQGGEVALIELSSTIRTARGFTESADEVMAALGAITPKDYGGTALYDAIVHGADLLAGRRPIRLLVVFTDGLDNASRQSLDDAVRAVVQARTAFLPVLTFLADPRLVDHFVEQIATWFYGPRMRDVEAGVKRLASSLATMAVARLPAAAKNARLRARP